MHSMLLVFFHAELKYITKLLCHQQFVCLFVFLLPICLNMAEALYDILNIVWAWKLSHNKDSVRVSRITDSQTVQADTYWQVGHETNSALCLRNIALLVVCRISLRWVAGVVCLFVVKCFVQKSCVYYIFVIPRRCLNHPDSLCNACGEFTFKSQRWNFTPLVKKIKVGPLIFVA